MKILSSVVLLLSLATSTTTAADKKCDETNFKCAMEKSDITYVTKDYRKIWVLFQSEVNSICNIANGLNIEHNIVITVVEDGKVTAVEDC